MLFAERNIALFFIKIQRRNELLDFIDRKRLVNGASCAGVFAASVADRAADHRERIVLLDQPECIFVAAFGCHLNVTLNRKMHRTGRFARRGTGRIDVDLRIVTIVVIPLFRGPFPAVRELGFRVLNLRPVLSAEFLAELCRTDRADLDALAAGHTLHAVHMRTVGGGGHVRGIEELGCPDCVADAGRAVADRDDFVLAVDIGDLVYIAVALCPFKDFQYFFLCDIMSDTPVIHVFGHIADADAVIAPDLAGTLAAHGLLLPAGTFTDAELVVHVKPSGNVLNRNRFRLH